MAGTLRVHASVDLRGLQQDLESVQLGLGREVGKAVKEAGGHVVRAIPRYTPFDPKHRSLRRSGDGSVVSVGHVRDSFDARSAGATTVAITSDHPAAPVIEFGGTIRPKGSPIRIREFRMVGKAGQAEAAAFERDLESRIDALLRHHNL